MQFSCVALGLPSSKPARHHLLLPQAAVLLLFCCRLPPRWLPRFVGEPNCDRASLLTSDSLELRHRAPPANNITTVAKKVSVAAASLNGSLASSGDLRPRTRPAPSPTPPSSSTEAAAGADDYRVAVFGAGGVGKSSLVVRFVNKTFNDSYVPTIEDTFQQVISANQKNVMQMQITDTTGTHQFPAMQKLSMSKGHAFIIVYSVTSRQSLEELGPIVLALKEAKGEQMAEVPIMLVGNKKDENQKREVATETGVKLAERWGCGFIETSAKSNENVTELFQQLLALERRRQLTLSVIGEEETKSEVKKKCSVM